MFHIKLSETLLQCLCQPLCIPSCVTLGSVCQGATHLGSFRKAHCKVLLCQASLRRTLTGAITDPAKQNRAFHLHHLQVQPLQVLWCCGLILKQSHPWRYRWGSSVLVATSPNLSYGLQAGSKWPHAGVRLVQTLPCHDLCGSLQWKGTKRFTFLMQSLKQEGHIFKSCLQSTTELRWVNA